MPSEASLAKIRPGTIEGREDEVAEPRSPARCAAGDVSSLQVGAATPPARWPGAAPTEVVGARVAQCEVFLQRRGPESSCPRPRPALPHPPQGGSTHRSAPSPPAQLIGAVLEPRRPSRAAQADRRVCRDPGTRRQADQRGHDPEGHFLRFIGVDEHCCCSAVAPPEGPCIRRHRAGR